MHCNRRGLETADHSVIGVKKNFNSFSHFTNSSAVQYALILQNRYRMCSLSFAFNCIIIYNSCHREVFNVRRATDNQCFDTFRLTFLSSCFSTECVLDGVSYRQNRYKFPRICPKHIIMLLSMRSLFFIIKLFSWDIKIDDF